LRGVEEQVGDVEVQAAPGLVDQALEEGGLAHGVARPDEGWAMFLEGDRHFQLILPHGSRSATRA
jgi:hypothetical protein